MSDNKEQRIIEFFPETEGTAFENVKDEGVVQEFLGKALSGYKYRILSIDKPQQEMGKLTKKAYQEMIQEDIKWLEFRISNDEKSSLEFRHIMEIIRDSVNKYYPPVNQPEIPSAEEIEKLASKYCQENGSKGRLDAFVEGYKLAKEHTRLHLEEFKQKINECYKEIIHTQVYPLSTKGKPKADDIIKKHFPFVK